MISNAELLMGTHRSDQDVSVHVWNHETANVETIYKGGGNVVAKALLQLGHEYVLTAEEDKPLLHVWPINSQEQVRNMRLVMPEKVTTLAADPSNNYLAVGIGSKLYIWHINSGKLLNVLQKHYQPITCVKFSSTGEHLVTAGADCMLSTYKFGDVISLQNSYLSQTEVGQCEPLYSKVDNNSAILDICIGVFGGNSRLGTSSSDQTCRIYNLHTGDQLLILIFDCILTTVLFDSPCWNAFIGNGKGLIRQVSLKNPPRTLDHHVDLTQTQYNFRGHTKQINCMHLNLTNSILASGSDDCCIILWEVKSRNIIRKFERAGVITNLRFILNHENLHTQSLKPSIILKPFERNVTNEFDNLSISLNQKVDITFSDGEEDDESDRVDSNTMDELNKAKVINKQLYNMFIKEFKSKS